MSYAKEVRANGRHTVGVQTEDAWPGLVFVTLRGAKGGIHAEANMGVPATRRLIDVLQKAVDDAAARAQDGK